MRSRAPVQSEVVLREKLRSSDVEVKALRDQITLLTESLGVQKKLLAAKIEEKEEVEYQWGEAKGRLAMREADYGQLEVRFHQLSCVPNPGCDAHCQYCSSLLNIFCFTQYLQPHCCCAVILYPGFFQCCLSRIAFGFLFLRSAPLAGLLIWILYGTAQVDYNEVIDLARKLKQTLIATKKISQVPALEDHQARLMAEL